MHNLCTSRPCASIDRGVASRDAWLCAAEPSLAGPPMIVTRRATPGELEAVERLLDQAGLPTVGVGEALEHFYLGLEKEAVVGCIGLELAGEAALLRSLAIVPTHRGRGESRALVRLAEEHAVKLGIRDIYLLTTTAQRLFERLGYRPIPRATAPSAIQATAEFGHLCPAQAVCMWRALTVGP